MSTELELDSFDNWANKGNIYGKPKGARNKRSQLLEAALKLKGFDCAAKIVELYNDKDAQFADKVKILFRVLQYTHPKIADINVEDIIDDVRPLINTTIKHADIIKMAKGEVD